MAKKSKKGKKPSTAIVPGWLKVEDLTKDLVQFEPNRRMMVAIPFKHARFDALTGEYEEAETVGIYPIVGCIDSELDDGRKVLVFTASEDMPVTGPEGYIHRRR
jgi:hypothetical protein